MIEKEKINIILEDSAKSIDKFEFNNETIEFARTLSKEYSNLCTQKNESIEDMPLYEKFLNLINKECGDLYKLTRDIKNCIRNMKNGIYREFDISEIENDITYIRFIANRER